MRYFIVTYLQQPNGKYNESVQLDDKIRKRYKDTAAVIIDYQTRTIVKSRMKNDEKAADFETLHKFYKGHYEDIISKLEAKYEILDELKEAVHKEVTSAD